MTKKNSSASKLALTVEHLVVVAAGAGPHSGPDGGTSATNGGG